MPANTFLVQQMLEVLHGEDIESSQEVAELDEEELDEESEDVLNEKIELCLQAFDIIIIYNNIYIAPNPLIAHGALQ